MATPGLVSMGSWSEETRAHPVGKFCEEFMTLYDNGDHVAAKEYISPTKYEFHKPSGQVVAGGSSAFDDQSREDFQIFAKWRHDPILVTIYETGPSKWELLSEMTMFANTVGKDPDGETLPKVKDASGKEWDVSTKLGVRMWFEESATEAKHMGLVTTKLTATGDTFGIMSRLVKKGVVKLSDIGL